MVWSHVSTVELPQALKGVAQAKLYRHGYHDENWPKASMVAPQSWQSIPDSVVLDGLPLVSQAIAEELPAEDVWCLPVAIKRGRTMLGTLFALRSRAEVNCISWRESAVSWSRKPFASPLARVESLVLNERNLKSLGSVAAAAHLPNIVLMRKALTDQLAERFGDRVRFEPASGLCITFGADAAADRTTTIVERLCKLATEYGREAAAESVLDEVREVSSEDLPDWADNAWYHDGVRRFEGKDLENFESEIAQAYRQALLDAIRQRLADA
jgi:hypothetical protein